MAEQARSRARRRTRHLLRDAAEVPLGPAGTPDPDFFRQVVEQYQGLVFKYVHQLVRDHHLTQDLSQEVFLKVFRRFETYDPRHTLSTWLLRIAHNHVLDHLKKRKLRTVSIEQPTGATGVPLMEVLPRAQPDALQVVEARDRKERIKRAIDAMPVDQRGVLVLRYLEGRKLQDIAYILGVPIGTVKSRIQRARAGLQQKLREAL